MESSFYSIYENKEFITKYLCLCDSLHFSVPGLRIGWNESIHKTQSNSKKKYYTNEMLFSCPSLLLKRSFFIISPLSKSGLACSGTLRAASTDSLPQNSRRLLDELTRIPNSVRLDTLLQHHGICHRRMARKFCKAMEVTELVPRTHLLAQSDPSQRGNMKSLGPDDYKLRQIASGNTHVNPKLLRINGEPLPLAGVPLNLVMYKPPGVVCSHAEDEGTTVYDLLPKGFSFRKPVLSTIGRLDKAATGMLLFTQSGEFNDRLASPHQEVKKEYVVALKEPLSKSKIEVELFASGNIELADGTKVAPAALVPHKTIPNICRLYLSEGKFHQVRRMFAAIGHEVTGLHRASIGGLKLADMGLKEGEWRHLTNEELILLLKISEGSKKLTSYPEKNKNKDKQLPAVSKASNLKTLTAAIQSKIKTRTAGLGSGRYKKRIDPLKRREY